ncbi:double-strand break repair protein MRE11 [Cladophialophora yegresii CBS 114405]|uniref:Double-strand break repair protein n=1 Tax=Cladophialophora yegresii CBS 114405 TaxID=1182544 RepID=W9WAG5_9EURO|nr:double-strand break repair protein MRE11 [Cladophialophora yegresii CBS 114405]EXJ55554.1 double-strand break repair protein MRE11 [Cladophialophora yegresii CBS 114405]
MTDTITILVATDNHVGAHERNPVRGDDSWKTFHEIMCLARERDVDMVLLAGDLFHENKPSRKSMYNVMRSVRLNCLSDKPCELEMLSDESEHFDATFDHVNYEDPNINVGIPIFSIHGNHDDPTGEGHYSALDLLAVSGLVNYYGKIPQSDNIVVKPVLIQKGRTKLALYGLSNVRDERLHRTFRDQKVQFHRPSTQMEDWYNLICLHQNHHAYTDTSYLPENFLPDFLDLVIWGHEHECDIEPRLNPEMNFQVMQPGSSVATSLNPGEAVPKHVAILTVTGREMKCEPIRLKTVRPFVYKEIVLANDKEAVRIAKHKDDHRVELTRHLIKIVDGLIEQAKEEWLEVQPEPEHPDEEPEAPPLPLVRLRVETTSPDGITRFDIENPQRFSNRFIDKVANTNDVVQFHVKKKNAAARTAYDAEVDEEIMAKFQGLETIKVDELVKEFLEKQSLTILPPNVFGDAVHQYVDKDDKHAVETFVNQSLADQIKHLVRLQDDANEADDDDEEDLATQIEQQRAKMEEMFAKGELKISKNKARYKPKPDGWDSDLDGQWEDKPEALIHDSGDVEDGTGDEDNEDDTPAPATRGGARGRGRGRGKGGRGGSTTASATSTRKTAAKPTAKKPAAVTAARGRKRAAAYDNDDDDDEEEEEEDIVMGDDDDGEEPDSQAMFVPEPKRKGASNKAPAPATRATRHASPASVSTTTSRTAGRAKPASFALSTASTTTKKTPARAAATKARQTQLNFTHSQNSILGNGKASGAAEEISDDDDDAFEPVPPTRRRR